MWADKIDDSAIALAGVLGPEGIDRLAVLPVAVVALWSTTAGRVALETQKGESGCWFPRGTNELPIVATGEGQSAAEVGRFLTPITARLGIVPHQIARVYGLLANGDVDSSLFNGGPSPEGNRRFSILPFRIDIAGKPNMRHASWYNPSDAEEQLRHSTALRQRVGMTVLTRSLQGTRTVGV